MYHYCCHNVYVAVIVILMQGTIVIGVIIVIVIISIIVLHLFCSSCALQATPILLAKRLTYL